MRMRTEKGQFAYSEESPIGGRELLVGYFQHHSSVEAVKSLILPELYRWTDSATGSLADAPATILHVRRGDLTQGDLPARMGLLTAGYYAHALALLEVEPRECLVTTDDVQVARSLLADLGIERFLGPGDLSPSHVLALMSRARGVVAANSTLSWWGAYLASNRGADVVLPRPWCRDWTPPPGDALEFDGCLTAPAHFADAA